MDFEKIKDLMKTLDNSNLMDFELKLNDGFYLRMNKHKGHCTKKNKENNQIKETPVFEKQSAIENIAPETNQNDLDNQKSKSNFEEGNIVTCPIVGTFYASSSPSKPPFVKIGDKVKEGDIICIIEAMKVMNEIKSQFEGEIAEIFVSNEDMVEYGQPLFRII